MVRFNGVNHLAFVAGDMDKTVRFWRDLLGMRLVATIGEPGFRHYFFELSETDTVAFFEWGGVESSTQPCPSNGHSKRELAPKRADIPPNLGRLCRQRNNKSKKSGMGREAPRVLLASHMHGRSFPPPRPRVFLLRSQTERRRFVTNPTHDLNGNRQILWSPVRR